MTLSDRALVTLADVLDELNKSSDSGTVDARLERYIEEASSLCARYCDRAFERDPAISEAVAPLGGTKLYLKRGPINAVTSVTVDGAVLDSGDYDRRLNRFGEGECLYRASGWPWPAGVEPSPGYPQIPDTEDETITVVYDGGYITGGQSTNGHATYNGQTPTVPADLAGSVLQMVCTRWHGRGKDRRITQETHEGATYTYGGVPLPVEVTAVWDFYRHWGQA